MKKKNKTEYSNRLRDRIYFHPELYFKMTVNLGCIALSMRYMRERVYAIGASPELWNEAIVNHIKEFPLEKINRYAEAGAHLHWDPQLVKDLQAVDPDKEVNWEGPFEAMEDQLRRLGLTDPEIFDEWVEAHADPFARALIETKGQLEAAEVNEYPLSPFFKVLGKKAKSAAKKSATG